uniref:Cytochrome c oxidase assembly factor 3 mitochondrial coiled-coil domain-containing protein n=1 Tax=Picea sitchensis TaxID=3332 RepID=A9NXK1_PICSI|nr:unknown [Picea sitchensis]
MSGFRSFTSLTSRSKNIIVAGGLTGFVAAVYIYTMRAVGSTDELQTAIETFEKQKSQESLPTVAESTRT